MKSIFFLVFSFFFTQHFHAQLKPHVYYKVSYVNDGDTFMIKDENLKKYKIRLIGIDAPESVNYGLKKHVQFFGYEAKKYLQQLLYKKRVKLEFDVVKYDKYGRILAYTYLENGIFLNEYLLKKGYAKVYTFPPNVKYLQKFLYAERLARKQKIGLWKL